MIDTLCIVGGGTSGLISALLLRQSWPDLKITIIESSNIGIIGVGEGSTEHWKKFINQINVNVPDLIRETGATYKIGIKFTNWNGDGKSYFHSLSEQFGTHDKSNGLPYTWYRMVGENWDPLETSWSLSRDSRHVEPLHDIVAQYHFDTFKLNSFLHKLCKERNINIVDTEIEDVILDQEGYVDYLIDKAGKKYQYEFYIDSSGFKRIIGSKLGAEWVDCKKYLPMNSAIAFPTGYEEDIPSYTEATALSSGWTWRIPTQDRFGNGYVYCDDFINKDQAFKEVQSIHKEKIEIGREFKFGAGYLKNPWIKNCVMIGLSGIFVEPLEASSIGTTIQTAFMLCPAIAFFEKGENFTANKYNKDIVGIANNIIDFIQLHYFTNRNDSPFWRSIKNEMVKTDFNDQYLEYFKKNFPNVFYFNTPLQLFSHLNFAQVMHGLGMFDTKNIKMIYDNHMKAHLEEQSKLDLVYSDNPSVPTYSHREAINILKERYETLEYKF